MKRRRAAVAAVATLALSTALGASATTGVAAATPNALPAAASHPAPIRYVPPVPLSKMRPVLAKYRHYVHHQITQLVPAVNRLHQLLASGNRSGAEAAWLDARLVWLRIGQDNSAYGVFGDLGQSIDGTAAGHPHGVHDSKFTGFHRIEYDLWRRHSMTAATHDAATLVSSVQRLAHTSLTKAIPSDLDGANGFVLRSHEVIEDAVRDTLSGNDEYGSGTGLASVIADAAATRGVIRLLTPMINHRKHGLVAKVKRQLSRLVSIAKTGQHHGRWVAIAALPRDKRQQVNAAAGAADETLSVVPELLEG